MELEAAPTVRQAKWELTLRLIDYLNRKWAHATAHGQPEITLKFPTTLVVTLSDALRHMMDARMPLYRLHVDVEAHSRAMVAEAGVIQETAREAVLRASEAISQMESVLRRYGPRPRRAGPKPRGLPVHAHLGFGG